MLLYLLLGVTSSYKDAGVAQLVEQLIRNQ